MKKKHIILITTLVVVLFLGFSYPTLIKSNIKVERNDSEGEMKDLKKEAVDIVDIPEKSGPVKNLPWVNDEEFLEAQKNNNSQVLMAGYCAVLTDPLPGEEFNVDFASESLKGMVIQANEIFSQNEKLGPYTEERGYKKGASFAGANIVQTEGGGVCKIASSLYNAAIYSDLEIIERYNHTMPVNYVPYGQDATVAFYGYKDIKFKNDRDFPILIWSEFIENRLYIGFYGQVTSPEVEWNHRIIDTTEASKEYINNPDLSEGEEKVIRKGIDGAKVESWITIKYKNGQTKTKNLGISSYIPMPYLIEINR